jgi:sigma-B regulation protein RsbU (phosphoserine phosphatase)
VNPLPSALPPDSAGDIHWLASISQDFAASLSMAETLDNAIAQIMAYMEVEAASIFLLNAEATTLTCQACAGAVDIRGLSVAAGHGIVGRAVSSGRTQMVRDVAVDGDFSKKIDELTGFQTRSILCAPLQVKGRMLGALEVINKRAANACFDDADQQLLQALAGVVSLAVHNARMAEALVEQERLRRELDLAREIQRGLLPQAPIGKFPVCGINLPALEVSGDFYDFFPLPDGRIVWGLGDVSGKGMNAALLMAKTISLFRCLGKREDDLGRLLATLNDEIAETALYGMFVTMVLGTFDPASGEVRLTNAGHQPPLLRHADGRYEEFELAGPPLGVLPGMGYEIVSFRLGDGRLFVFTDGVTEGYREDGTMLGLDGLQAIFDAHAGATASEQLAAVAATLQGGGRRLRDDLTLLAIGL